MGNPRRAYKKEFKLETLKLAETSENSVSQIEREMGLPAGIIFRWQRQLRRDGDQAFPGHGNLKEAETRIEQLEKEVASLRMERDTLKKRPLSFRRTRSEIPIHPRSTSPISNRYSVRGFAGIDQRVL